MHKYPHGLTSALFILLLILFSLKAQLMLTDTDYWWHLSAGDLIRKLGTIPKFDVFSFTAENYPWLNISWGWDIAISFIRQYGGMQLPLFFTALLSALTIALLFYFILQRGAGPLIAIIVILVALVPVTYMLTPRPHQMTFLMTIIFYILLHKNSFKRMIFLPLLMIIWVNTHGGFIVGFVIIGAYLIENLLERRVKNLSYLALIFLLCLLTTLINPLGIHIFEACNRTFSSALIPIISEWQPLQFNQKYLLHCGYVLLVLITFKPLSKKVSFAEKLLVIIWAIAALMHERNLPIFVLLSAPTLSLNLSALMRGNFADWVANRNIKYDHDFTKPRVKCAIFYLAIFISLGLSLGGNQLLIQTSIPPSHPIEEVAFVNKNYKNRKILNDYFQGGFLLNQLTDDSKIFIDGRAETAYPQQVVKDYLKFYLNQPGWEKMLDNYNIDTIIIPRVLPNNSYFEANQSWQKVFSGPLDNIYIKQ